MARYIPYIPIREAQFFLFSHVPTGIRNLKLQARNKLRIGFEACNPNEPSDKTNKLTSKSSLIKPILKSTTVKSTSKPTIKQTSRLASRPRRRFELFFFWKNWFFRNEREENIKKAKKKEAKKKEVRTKLKKENREQRNEKKEPTYMEPKCQSAEVAEEEEMKFAQS
ncbi:hypothetical protein C1646_786479 [Rhizophagus diaphanus]|nr:hypothetical protein C1646_786479 [Rhizophagus diaphanus] [Rhizophagus sp. MUCL 43196]